MDWYTELPKLYRNKIEVKFGPRARELPVGSSKFGGRPDVPADFVWPTFETATYDDDTVRARPLAFLAQFNCAQPAPLDREGLLPKTGLLSFFYELDSQRWGFDPKDKDCARVYWFEGEALSPAAWPQDLGEEFRLPQLAARLEQGTSAPDWADVCPALEHDWTAQELRPYDVVRREIAPYPENCSKLLGWPDIIQNNMTLECELVSRGYYLGGAWDQIPQQERDGLRTPSVRDWQLLFQLDTVEDGDFELMFGDCGRIYFYIRREDLAQRRFDRVWLIQQCC